MKKAALFMACALAVTALAGCSSSSSTAETTAAAGGTATEAAGGSEGGEVNMIMTWWGNQVRNERTQQALDLYAEQNPGVHIEGQFSEWSDTGTSWLPLQPDRLCPTCFRWTTCMLTSM